MAKYRKKLNLNEMSIIAKVQADKTGTSYTEKKILLRACIISQDLVFNFIQK